MEKYTCSRYNNTNDICAINNSTDQSHHMHINTHKTKKLVNNLVEICHEKLKAIIQFILHHGAEN